MPSCLLQAADAVLEARRSRDGPGPGQRLGVAQVRPELRRRRRRRCGWARSRSRRARSRQGVDVRHQPRLRAVGEVAVGQEDHRRAVRRARSGRPRSPRRSSRWAIGARCTGTGASPLRPNMAWSRSDCSVLVGSPVEGPPRWMSHTIRGSSSETARPMVSRLQRQTGSGGRGHAEVTTERRPQGRADTGDLVLGLEGADVEALVLAQLVQDVRRRGDRVGAEEQREL